MDETRSQREKLIRAEERAKAEEEEKRLLEPPKEEKKKGALIPLSKPMGTQDDNIYYNISLTNNTNSISAPVSYKRTLNDPLINNPSDYELAVTRFSIPGGKIPIMVWETFLNPYQTFGSPVIDQKPWDPVENISENILQASELGFLIGEAIPANNDTIIYDNLTGFLIFNFVPLIGGTSLQVAFPPGNKIRFTNNFGPTAGPQIPAGDYDVISSSDFLSIVQLQPAITAGPVPPTKITNAVQSVSIQGIPGSINPNYNPSSKVDKFWVIMTAPDLTPPPVNVAPAKPVTASNYQGEIYENTQPDYSYDFTKQQPFETTVDGAGRTVQRVYRTVSDIQEFLYMVNQAILEASISLRASLPAITSNARPFFRWNSGAQICELLAPKSEFTSPEFKDGVFYPEGTYWGLPSVEPRQILYFNQPLYYLFQSLKFVNTFPHLLPPDFSADGYTQFPNSTIGNIVYRVDFYETGDNVETINGTDYVVMRQSNPTVALWNDASEIVFETDTIPVNPEFQTGSEENNSSTKVRRTLITDFLTPETINLKDQIIYSGLGWKRYTDLNSSYPLREISVTAKWRDTWGNTYPINEYQEQED
jgi:hypothetical protein